MRKIVLLALLWAVLAADILVLIHQKGGELYYPVVVAWLGGLVSIELVQAIIQHNKKDIS